MRLLLFQMTLVNQIYLKKNEGKTTIKFELQDKQNKLVFDLKDKRKIDFKQLNSLKIKENLILD